MSNFLILQDFHNKCVQNNIWYSLFGLTLLNHKRGMKNSKANVIEVVMTVEDYHKFVNLYPENIIDSMTRSNYFFTCPFYFKNDYQQIIKITLLAKGSIKKTEKFYSIKNWMRQNIGFYKTCSKYSKDNFIKKVFFKFVGLFWSPLTWQEVSSTIYDDKFNGLLIIDWFNQNINRNWLLTISNETKQENIDGINVNILKEWNIFLNKKYGFDWKHEPILKDKKIKNFSWIKNFKN